MSLAIENETEKLVQLHGRLQDMLAGYADHELDNEQADLVEAHLAGCEHCRNDLARQRILTQRFESIPAQRVPAELDQRFDKMLLDASSQPYAAPQPLIRTFISPFVRGVRHLTIPLVLGSTGWALALVLLVVILQTSLGQRQHSEIPMIHDALVEYYEMAGKTLPASMKSNLPEAPVTWPNAHLLASWKTNVGGSPAQVFAFRSGKHIIFQYQINESVFFRNPSVREAIANFGKYTTRNNKADVLAVPLVNAGVIVVGPTDSLPKPDQLKYKTI